MTAQTFITRIGSCTLHCRCLWQWAWLGFSSCVGQARVYLSLTQHLKSIQHTQHDAFINPLLVFHHRDNFIYPSRDDVGALNNRTSEQIDSLFDTRIFIQSNLLYCSDAPVVCRRSFVEPFGSTLEEPIGEFGLIQRLK